MIEKQEVIWFVHLKYAPPLPLRFRRTADFGADVVGGASGSHNIGHGETYWEKFSEIIKLGYIPVDVAKELGMLPDSWKEPDVRTLEESLKRGDYKHIDR